MLFKTADPWPHSHHDVIDHYNARYERQIASGESQPFLYPWGTLGGLIVIIYLLIPHQHRPWLRKCRFLVFAWITGFATYCTIYTKARGMAAALGVGLMSAWGVVWVSAIIICNDAQTDFMRIERREGVFGSTRKQTSKAKESNGNIVQHESNEKAQNGQASDIMSNSNAGPRDRHGTFAWQPYPLSPFIERLDWVCDVFSNFRGAGWNWRTSALPPPPKWVQEQLRQNAGETEPKHSSRIHEGQPRTYNSKQELLWASAKRLFVSYLVLDALKTAMMHDPYFWGISGRPAPPYLVALTANNPVLIHIYRMTLSMLGVKYALQNIFALGPLFFSGLLGSNLLGARAEAWMFPETYGSVSIVLNRGLAGWWSSWWHQTFRFAFEQHSRKVVEVLGMDKTKPFAKLLQLVIAFALSGVLHASGSYTCAGDTRPLQGPMTFFMVQAMAIFAEVVLSQALRSTGLPHHVPKRVMQVFTFVYVHVWFYFTAHLLCDDFGRGGVWLFEPIPVSIFRGLGFGADARDGWWCWGGQLIWWHQGDTWWKSGLAF